jgi:hypothetical protein
MGLGFLPWEKWLPPYVYGPAFIAISLLLVFSDEPGSWWHYALLLFAFAHGTWVTWMWIRHGRNVLKELDSTSPKKTDAGK